MVLIVTNTATARNLDQVVFEGVRCAGVYLTLSTKGREEHLSWLALIPATIQAFFETSLVVGRHTAGQAHCCEEGVPVVRRGFEGGVAGGIPPHKGGPQARPPKNKE